MHCSTSETFLRVINGTIKRCLMDGHTCYLSSLKSRRLPRFSLRPYRKKGILSQAAAETLPVLAENGQSDSAGLQLYLGRPTKCAASQSMPCLYNL